MATDIKSLVAMIAGGVVAVGAMRTVKPDLFGATDLLPAFVKLPEMGMGLGKDNLPNTAYIVPAAIAAGAYFLL